MRRGWKMWREHSRWVNNFDTGGMGRARCDVSRVIRFEIFSFLFFFLRRRFTPFSLYAVSLGELSAPTNRWMLMQRAKYDRGHRIHLLSSRSWHRIRVKNLVSWAKQKVSSRSSEELMKVMRFIEEIFVFLFPLWEGAENYQTIMDLLYLENRNWDYFIENVHMVTAFSDPWIESIVTNFHWILFPFSLATFFLKWLKILFPQIGRPPSYLIMVSLTSICNI